MNSQQIAVPPPYPLAWPPSRPRRKISERQRPRYKGTTFENAMHTIEVETSRWTRRAGARLTNYELTTNHVGRPTRELSDPGAALWFTLAGPDITRGQELMVLACDLFNELPQNIRAISLTMERLRLVDEIGAYSLISAVEGAKALPPPPEVVNWREVLGLGHSATLTAANAVYRALAKDLGEGSPRLRDLNAAIEAARQELSR